MNDLNMPDIDIEGYTSLAIELAMAYLPKLLLAIVTLIVGFWVIGKFANGLKKVLELRQVDRTLQDFLRNLLSAALKIMLIISVASMIGVETASFIAALGAAGLAFGLALQGSLSNFAGGVLILFFRPFKVDDIIEAQGFLGTVKEVQIFNTIINTLDNQRVIIPNGILSNGPIKNLFAEPTRRVDLTFGISYDDDITKAKAILQNLIESDSRILKDPSYEIYVSAHADSSINILTRSWTLSEDYWGVHFDLLEKVKYAFDNEDITIPFPQRDVHVHQAA